MTEDRSPKRARMQDSMEDEGLVSTLDALVPMTTTQGPEGALDNDMAGVGGEKQDNTQLQEDSVSAQVSISRYGETPNLKPSKEELNQQISEFYQKLPNEQHLEGLGLEY